MTEASSGLGEGAGRRSSNRTILIVLIVSAVALGFLGCLGILGIMVVWRVRDAGQEVREVKARLDMEEVRRTAEAFYHEQGRYPASIEEMVGASAPDGSPGLASLDELPRDPWGREYLYELVRGEPRVTCLGSDGAEGGEGEAADIVIEPPPDR